MATGFCDTEAFREVDKNDLVDQNGHHQKNLETINAGEGVEKREHSCTVGGNVN